MELSTTSRIGAAGFPSAVPRKYARGHVEAEARLARSAQRGGAGTTSGKITIQTHSQQMVASGTSGRSGSRWSPIEMASATATSYARLSFSRRPGASGRVCAI